MVVNSFSLFHCVQFLFLIHFRHLPATVVAFFSSKVNVSRAKSRCIRRMLSAWRQKVTTTVSMSNILCICVSQPLQSYFLVDKICNFNCNFDSHYIPWEIQPVPAMHVKISWCEKRKQLEQQKHRLCTLLDVPSSRDVNHWKLCWMVHV